MPLFFQHIINETTRLGIWKIDEPELFFLEQVPLQRAITHPHKRLQHLAGRYLLKYFFPDFPYHEIAIADTRKPYLPYEQYHFSISHCGDYAAAIISSTHRVGIDIEIPSEKVERIKHKFLSGQENMVIDNLLLYGDSFLPTAANQLPTVIWSAKEAVFKWYGLGEVDFKKHICLTDEIAPGEDEWLHLLFAFLKHELTGITVYSKLFENLVLSYCIS